MSHSPDGQRLTADIPWRTIFRLLAAAALVWLWLQLYDLVLVLAVAIVLAVALNPIVVRVERFGIPRWLAATGVCFVLAAIVAAFLWATWTSVGNQAAYMGQHFSELADEAIARLPEWMRSAVEGGTKSEATSFLARHALTVARSTMYAVTVTVLAFIVTIYLLIEGRETRKWVLAFVPPRYMSKVDRTLSDSETVIYGYVVGNVVTSICATVFMLVVLSLLNVPAALLLALLTGLFDVIPVIGSIIPVVPAFLLALTVSTTTAVLVVVAHIVYNSIENYLIAPWAYGGPLKLSNLAVVLALVIGGEIAGVIGALIALPIAALYPSIERIWLRSQVGEDTVRQHRALESR